MILDKIFKRKYVENNNGQSEEEKSDRDSGKGESDHDTINPAGGPKCDENCLRLGTPIIFATRWRFLPKVENIS